jgi:hypothetical protein
VKIVVKQIHIISAMEKLSGNSNRQDSVIGKPTILVEEQEVPGLCA